MKYIRSIIPPILSNCPLKGSNAIAPVNPIILSIPTPHPAHPAARNPGPIPERFLRFKPEFLNSITKLETVMPISNEYINDVDRLSIPPSI